MGAPAPLRLQPIGPFSLAASTRFLEGFAPAAHRPSELDGHLHLAFVLDGTATTVGVCAWQPEGDDSPVVLEVIGVGQGTAEQVAAADQTARILSLDIDGEGWPEVGRRDPVVGVLQERYGLLRPVGFLSPYEAAAWALIGQRIRIVQAAAIKATIADRLGEHVEIHGEDLAAFPAPERLATDPGLETIRGLNAVKVERLRALGREAARSDTILDAGRLRAMGRDAAVEALQALSGIGPFGAEHILLRGVGVPDEMPTTEPRVPRAVALAYDLDHEPDQEELVRIAVPWRPYRMWVILLLRANLEAATGEIRRGRPASTGRVRPT